MIWTVASRAADNTTRSCHTRKMPPGLSGGSLTFSLEIGNENSQDAAEFIPVEFHLGPRVRGRRKEVSVPPDQPGGIQPVAASKVGRESSREQSEWTRQRRTTFQVNERCTKAVFCHPLRPLDVERAKARTLRARQRTGGLLSPAEARTPAPSRQGKKIILFSSEQNRCFAHLKDEDLVRAEVWLASAWFRWLRAVYRCL